MKLYGLIGMPLDHSRSQEWFTARFQEAGLADCRYENFPLSDIEELPALLKAYPQLRGLNVTSPYKRSVIPFLNEISDEARRTGSVNCIVVEAGKLTGYNTDCYGFRMSLSEFLGDERPEGALLLGTGGAASAAAVALSELGIACLQVSRTPAERILGYDELDAAVMNEHRLVINATPLGMPHNPGVPPIPYRRLGPEHILYDMIYNPPFTSFLRLGAEAGARTINGLRMLELQAERTWETFGFRPSS